MQIQLSSEYVSPKFADLLQQHQLANFKQLWAYEGEWFEAPNKKRGGWSGVNYIELTDDAGQLQGFYLKRQEGYMRKTWRHPIKGEPTFEREFKILKFLMPSQVVTPTLAYFAKNGAQSILMTAALAGYISADEWMQTHETDQQHKHAAREQKQQLIKALATAVRAMHTAKVQHRALYLKHLFVKPNINARNQFDVALIDFEKSRVTSFINIYRLMDLTKLWHRAPLFSLKNKLVFYKSYFNVKQLNAINKKIFVWLLSRH